MTPNSILKGVLLMAAVFAVTEVGLLVRDFRMDQRPLQYNAAVTAWNTRKASALLPKTIEEIHGTAKTVNTYTEEQAKVFNSKENRDMQVALRLSAATAIKILRQIDRKTLPEINATVAELRKPIGSLNALVLNTDESMNRGLVPKLDTAINEATATIKTLNNSIVEAGTGVNVALADIHTILADDSIAQSIDSMAQSAAHIEGMTASAKEAARELPGIAKDIRKVSDASGKASKWYWAVKIGVVIKDVFFH